MSTRAKWALSSFPALRNSHKKYNITIIKTIISQGFNDLPIPNKYNQIFCKKLTLGSEVVLDIVSVVSSSLIRVVTICIPALKSFNL